MSLPGSHAKIAILTLAAMTSVGSLPAASSATHNLPVNNLSTSLQVVVTARKWAEPLQGVPGSLAVQPAAMLQASGAQELRDAARAIPNLTLGEFTARRLTFPYLRGIGSGQNDPAVTICLDGVPQLSYVTANQQLLDVERIEYLRGPQGALYGRNTLGGAINIVPHLPSHAPGGSVTLATGSYEHYAGRFMAEGPLGFTEALGSISGGYSTRAGYTRNDITRHDLDSREAWFSRAQLYLPEQGRWDFRLSVTTERDRDGDYALYDLASIRDRPHHASHDYEGFNNRDLAQPVFTARRQGDLADFTSITAFQWWQTHDLTDLDTTPYDLQRKNNRESFHALIEELRLASPVDTPVHLCDRLTMQWLTGLFAFDSGYTQHAITDYRPGGVAFGYWPYPFALHNHARLDNQGVSLFGQAILTLDERWNLGLGLREDWERRAARLHGPSLSSSPERDFHQLSPHASLIYRFTPEIMLYAEISKGFRAGGFNAATNTSYDQETSWNYETGLKTAWLHNGLIANLALFHTDWEKLQVNTHVPGGAASDYYIENGGQATSQGVELELTARPVTGLEVFGGMGLVDATYRNGSHSADQNISGHDLPFAPHGNWHVGSQHTQELTAQQQAFLRLEVNGMSRYAYDPSNAQSQGSYTLVNIRLGVVSGTWRAECWVQNLLDRDYVPLAIPYGPGFYVGECGAPRTLGVSLTRTF